MNRLMAFRGIVECKAELACALKDSGALSRILCTGRAGDLRFDFLAQEYGLDPSLLRLMVALCAEAADPVGRAFLWDVVDGIALDADSAAIVTSWLIWCVFDAKAGLLGKLGGRAHEAAAAVGAAVQKSRETPVSPEAWRSARRKLSRIDAGPVERLYLNAVAAMAWDLTGVPGLVQDVVMSCGQAIKEDVYRQEGWSSEQEIEVIKQYRAYFAETSSLAEVTSIPDLKERQHVQQAAVEGLWRSSGKVDHLEMQKRCASEARGRIEEWTNLARAALVAGARASSQMIV